MAGSLGDLIVRVGAEISGFVYAMSTVADKMNQTADKVEERLEGMERMGRRLAIAGAELSAAVTIPIVGLGMAAIETAGKFEQIQIAFTHFLGSVKAAKNYLADLYEFAKTTPFQITDITQGATKLMAMGFAAKEVTPMLRLLGDQLSAVGRMDQLGNIILAFGEMKAKGVASMKEIRQMVTDGVIPALRYLSEALGVTEARVMEMLKAKAISSAVAIKAITEGMARDTGGMMLEQMGSFVGMMTNVKDNLTLTLKAIGDTLIPYAKTFSVFANAALEMVKNIAQGFASLPEPVRAFILTLLALAAALGPVLVVVGGLALVIPTLVAALAPIGAVLGLTTGAFLGWAAAIPLVLASLVALGVWVAQNWGPIRASVMMAWSGITEMWMPVWTRLKDFLLVTWNLIKGAAEVVWGGIGGFVTSAGKHIVEYLQIVWTMIKSTWEGLANLASKIPGMDKIFAVGDAFAFAKAQQQIAEALKGTGEHARQAAPAIKKHGEEIEKLGGKVATAHSQLVKWNEKTLEYALHMQEMAVRTSVAKDEMDAFNETVTSGAFGEGAQGLAQSINLISKGAAKTFRDLNDTFRDAMKDNLLGDWVRRAYETLGIESTEFLKRQAVDADNALKMIQRTGQATAEQLGLAWIKAEEARQKYVEGSGGKVSGKDKLNLAIKKDSADKGNGLLDSMGKNSFAAFNQSFNGAIQGLLNGTATFRSAWGGMVQTMYQSWVGTLANMATRWAAHQIAKLALHVMTNFGIVASDAAAASASNSIGIAQHLKEIVRAASKAAARAFASMMELPPPFNVILAPVAAAAAFAGTMAFGMVSAERGADLPNYNTMGVLHPREMVLPREQADVIRGLARGGQGKSGGDTHNYHGGVNYHAAQGEKLTERKLGEMFESFKRNRPGLRLA